MSRSDPETGRRFRALIDHLAALHADGKTRGWQARVGAQLGIKAPHLTKILSGERPVGLELAHRVAARIGLDPRYFTDPNPDDWLIEHSLNQVPLEQRKAFQLDLAGVRARARDLRRMVRAAPDHPRLVAEALRVARDLLESVPVQTARELIGATPKAQRDLAARLASSLLDLSDPFDRAEAEPNRLLDEMLTAIDCAADAFLQEADARGIRDVAERQLGALVAGVISEVRAGRRPKPPK